MLNEKETIINTQVLIGYHLFPSHSNREITSGFIKIFYSTQTIIF